MDMVYLTSGSFWAFVSQFMAAAIALVLAIIVAHFIPKDAYGTYKYVLAVVGMLATFSLSGIGQAVFQSIARGFRRSLADGFIANLRWSLLIFLGALAVGGYYLFAGNQTLGIGILLGGCLTPFLSSFNLYTALFNGEKDFKRTALYGGGLTNFIPALALTTVALTAPTALNLVIAYFVGNIAAAAFTYWRGARRYRPAPNAERDPGLLSYGKHLSFMGILGGIAGNIDQLLLFHFGGAIDLAIYNFAIAIPDQIKGPLKMIDTMTQARFVNRDTRDIHRSIYNKMMWLTITSIVIIGVYIVAAPFIYQWLFPAYRASVPYSQIFVFSLLSIITYPLNSYLSAHKKIFGQYGMTIVGSTFQIVAMVFGVVYAGLLGLVIARVATRLFVSLTAVYFYRNAIRT